MIKKGFYLVGLALLVVLISSGFDSIQKEAEPKFSDSQLEVVNYSVPLEEEVVLAPQKNNRILPLVGKTFVGFRQAIAMKESRGRLNCINPYGYMGKFQFGKSTLRSVGIYDFNTFLKNENWQNEAFKALIAKNKWELRREIEKYNGRVINGIEITESGLIAAAHLGGAGSVRRFLRSNGRRGFKDAFWTSIISYMKRFGGYDISHIKANKKAKAKIS